MWRAAIVILLLATTIARADEASDLDAFAKSGTGCEKTRAHCFGIQLHVSKSAELDGAFVVTTAWMADQIAMAQKHFATLDVGWEIVGADALAADKAATLHSRTDRDALAAKGLSKQVVDVYITGQLDDVDTPGNMVYGVTWHTKAGRKYIIVSAKAWPRTLAHELGHFFGLPHSTYAISIMNKTQRDVPKPEDRRFADEEFAAMKPVLKQLVRDKIIVERSH